MNTDAPQGQVMPQWMCNAADEIWAQGFVGHDPDRKEAQVSLLAVIIAAHMPPPAAPGGVGELMTQAEAELLLVAKIRCTPGQTSGYAYSETKSLEMLRQHVSTVLARSAAQAEAYNAALLDFLDAEAARRGCDLSICEVRDENERIQWAGIEWGEETSVRAAIEELRQCARKGGGS